MERESNSMHVLCRAGCGFYGSQATEGLCSMCYKESLKKKQQQPNVSSSPSTISASQPSLLETDKDLPVTPVNPILVDNSDQVVADEAGACSSRTTPVKSKELDEDQENKDEDVKKKKNRCSKCRKKVGLTGFDCRCGGLFCTEHRYSDKHDCTFDYRELGAQEIRRKNPVVVGQKIQKL